MEYSFPDNTNHTNVTYMRTRTGPNFFRVYYKQGCCIRFTPKEVGAVFGVARFTPGVNAIRDWCYEMVKQYGSEEDKVMMVILTTLLSMALVPKYMKNQMTILKWLSNEN